MNIIGQVRRLMREHVAQQDQAFTELVETITSGVDVDPKKIVATLEKLNRPPSDLEQAIEQERRRGQLETLAAMLNERAAALGKAQKLKAKTLDDHAVALEKFERRRMNDEATVARLQHAVSEASKARSELRREFPDSQIGKEEIAKREASTRDSKVRGLRDDLRAVDYELKCANAKKDTYHPDAPLDAGLARTIAIQSARQVEIRHALESLGEPVAVAELVGAEEGK